jgi:hypothetical protein
MVRSVLIDPLALYNIAISEDHVVICHDFIMTDKKTSKGTNT